MNIYIYYSMLLLLISLIMLLLGLVLYMISIDFYFNIELIKINSISINFDLEFDWLNVNFIFIITFISSMVMYYSYWYMGESSNFKFIMLLNMFVFSMILMVISPNLISILLGWDGLGLVSFLLVVYYMSIKSYHSGMITVLMNRMGDLGLIMSIGWMFNYGVWNFSLINLSNMNNMFILFMLLFLAAFTKSAQIPFSSWLPAAMAAPTPVSSLVHSSTLVTAGVYLIIKLNIYYGDYIFSKILIFISMSTLIMASTAAILEKDLKKVIAMSTLSQLGFMLILLSLGGWYLCYLHMMMHAMFKANLFLCAGVLIHMNNGKQDIRYYGSSFFISPKTTLSFNISNFSLMGFPFLTGFFCKEYSIYMVFIDEKNIILLLIMMFGLMLTMIYMIRISIYVFSLNFNSNNYWLKESEFFIEKSLLSLSLLVVTIGVYFNYLMEDKINMFMLMNIESISAFILILVGIIVGMNIIMKFKKLFLFNFLSSMWFLYWLSGNSLIKIIANMKKINNMEYNVIDYFSSLFYNKNLLYISYYFMIMNKNSLKLYMLILILMLNFI